MFRRPHWDVGAARSCRDRSSCVLLTQVEDILLGTNSRCVCDLCVESEELTAPAVDSPCLRLEIRSGLGVRSGSPNPPLATGLLNTSLAIDIVTCGKWANEENNTQLCLSNSWNIPFLQGQFPMPSPAQSGLFLLDPRMKLGFFQSPRAQV